MHLKFIWLVVIVFFTSANVLATEPIHEKFSHQNIFQNISVSPDGNNIAAVYNSADGPQIVLMDYPTINFTPLVKLKQARERVESVQWSGNDYLVVTLSYPEYLNGKVFRVGRAYSIELGSNKVKPLINKHLAKDKYHKLRGYSVASMLPNDPQHILMSAYDSKDVAVSVFKVNLKNSKFKKIIVNKYEINGWVADKQGNIRLGIQLDKDRATSVVERTIWYRKDNNSDMEKLHSRKTFDGETFWPIALNDEATKAYVVSDHQTRRDSLWLFDIVNNKFEKMIYGHEKYDIDGALKNSQGEVIGVYYFDDFKRNYYFDQKSNNLTKTVSNVLKNTDSAHVVSASKDKKRIIAWAQSPNKVPVYYYIDLRNQKAGAWLAQIPQLVKQPMMTTQNIEFKARDGKIIPGYLTIPQGVEKPALVVLPHGGPNARDYRYFDPIKQFIAAKGHAVLQVNFRGSTGFGSDFETDGYMGWGKQMQQDIYDGMDYVVENFSVSKKDACVVGFSYGGYVALTSAFQEPNRFDCVASISGISDVKELVKDENNWFFDLNNIVDMSDSKAIDELEHVSAINHIDRIKSPVLLIHGTKDTQVHHTQSSDFYDQAKKKVDVDYVEIKDGTHYFDDKESRKILFKELSAFLDKHL